MRAGLKHAVLKSADALVGGDPVRGDEPCHRN